MLLAPQRGVGSYMVAGDRYRRLFPIAYCWVSCFPARVGRVFEVAMAVGWSGQLQVQVRIPQTSGCTLV